MPSLIAVVEGRIDASLSWLRLPSEPPARWLRLHAASPDTEVAQVVATLASYNHPSARDRPCRLDERVDAKTLVLPGGLAAASADAMVYPSCCCGLEGWREWRSLLSSDGTPWLGHDPSPWVEQRDGGFVVWADGGLGGWTDSVSAVTFSRSEMEHALARVESDLQGFVDRLRDWSQQVLGTRAQRLADTFARHFDVMRGDA